MNRRDEQPAEQWNQAGPANRNLPHFPARDHNVWLTEHIYFPPLLRLWGYACLQLHTAINDFFIPVSKLTFHSDWSDKLQSEELERLAENIILTQIRFWHLVWPCVWGCDWLRLVMMAQSWSCYHSMFLHLRKINPEERPTRREVCYPELFLR